MGKYLDAIETFLDAIDTFLNQKNSLLLSALLNLCCFLWEVSHSRYGLLTWFLLFGCTYASILCYCKYSDNKKKRQQMTKADNK